MLGVAEMVSLDLILVMLAAGALVGMVAALIGLPVAAPGPRWRSAASVAMLALVRPAFVKRLHAGPELSLGHGKLVGKQGLVTEEITGLNAGPHQAGGEMWTAAPYDDNLTDRSRARRSRSCRSTVRRPTSTRVAPLES